MPDGAFAEHRPPLLSPAYKMLGGAAGAEEVLQEGSLRWGAVGPPSVQHAHA
ncbi:hypothetical protein [Streptomyces sp. NPDC101393]|uniref:hypothetical protein n=1 Tax=Streptomyces sp. NPDC101393 TaxID=3366141 RepID=UPI0038070C44